MGEVSAAVDALMSQLISISNSQSGSTQALINSAQSALHALVPPNVNLPLRFPRRENLPRPRTPQPPEVVVEQYVKPQDVPLDILKSLDDRFTEPTPKLDLPKTNPGAIANFFGWRDREADYTFNREDMDYSTQPLTVNVGAEPRVFPKLTEPDTISTEPLSGVPPNVPAPSFSPIPFDYQTPYRESLNEIEDKFREMHEMLLAAKAQFDAGDTDFIGVLRGAMTGHVWSMAHAEWAKETKDSELQDIYAERYGALKALDAQPQSVTGMPSGQRAEGLIKLEVEAAQKELQVLQKIEQTLRDKELEFYKLALTIGVNITEAAFSLRFQQMDLTQKAQQLVISISSDVIDLVTRFIDLKTQEFDYYARYNDAQVTRNKLMMEIEKTKLEAIRADLGSNELVLMYNENNAKVYSMAMRLLEQRVDQRKVENEHLIYKKRVEQLELDYFNKELEQHNENLRLFIAKQGKAMADLRENGVILDGAILESKVYRSELTKELSNFKVDILNSKAVSENDRLALSMYTEKNQGLIAELDALEEVSRIAVRAIMLGVEAESLEKTLEAQQQELEDENALYELQRNLKIEQLDLLNELKQFTFNAERLAKQADIMIQGAGVAGGLATQAFAGLNGVATGIMTEFA